MPAQHLWQSLALTLLTVASLWRVCTCDFLALDDAAYIVDNPALKLGLSWEGVKWALTTLHGNYWQPVTWLSFQLDASLYGYTKITQSFDPLQAGAWGFHTTNLVLHVLDVLLVYAVIFRLTGATGRSFVVAALFAVHPMHVESVAWVTERKDVLSMFFFLGALLAYYRWVLRPGLLNYLLLFVTAFLGMASKPMLVTLPAVLLLVDYWPLERFGPAISWKRAVLEKLPLFGLSLFFSAVTWYTQTPSRLPLTLEARFAGALAGYGWYLATTIWPTDLCVLYPYRDRFLLEPDVLLSLVVLLVVTGLVCLQARRRPFVLVGWLWFVGTLLPVSGLFQSGPQSYADRFVYLPHMGLFLAVVWLLGDLLETWRVFFWLRRAAAALLVLVLAYMSRTQVSYWRNTATMFEHVVQVTENNEKAYSILATYYYDRSRFVEAHKNAQRAVALIDKGHTHFLLAMSLGKLQRLTEVEPHLEKLMRHDPDRPEMHLEAAAVYDMLGRPAGVVEHLQKHLDRNPQDVRYRIVLARALIGSDQLERAAEVLQQYLQIDPEDAGAHLDLSRVFQRLNRPREAEYHLERAQQLVGGTIKGRAR